MKALQFPKLTNEQMYYLRKLSGYVFCVHNHKDDSATMYCWQEHIGGRGSDEIGSCLWDYLNKLPIYVCSVSIWADRCSGQNANFFLISMLMHFSVFRSVSVELHPFETGHSFQICDSNFSLIERKLPSVIELPEQVENIILQSRDDPSPFKVERMT